MASSDVMDSDLPEEISEKVTSFHESLSGVERLLSTVVSEPINKIHEKLPPVDKAKFDLVMAYSLNSLYWMYLITQGVNPKDHQVKSELERIREYMNKVKEIVDKEKRPRLDTEASKRFVKGALWTPKEDNGEDIPEVDESNHEESREQSDNTTPKTNKRTRTKARRANKKLKKQMDV